MISSTPWDFRDDQEVLLSSIYEKRGFVIEDADSYFLQLLKVDIAACFCEFLDIDYCQNVDLRSAHKYVGPQDSNDLRLFIMQKLFRDNSFLRNYYYSSKKVINSLCGNELAMQKRPGISINLPQNLSDVLPIHADTWNGVSPYELNIWIPFVDCSHSMSLYILEREKYIHKLNTSIGLLQLSSDELFAELREDLTWIPIQYGQILAFDQSLPHGYSLNEEAFTHWSMNCRFKGLHSPYWDKKLGEYFMPITVKSSTRLGIGYRHPENWL